VAGPASKVVASRRNADPLQQHRINRFEAQNVVDEFVANSCAEPTRKQLAVRPRHSHGLGCAAPRSPKFGANSVNQHSPDTTTAEGKVNAQPHEPGLRHRSGMHRGHPDVLIIDQRSPAARGRSLDNGWRARRVISPVTGHDTYSDVLTYLNA
jgi:hypothetical protein